MMPHLWPMLTTEISYMMNMLQYVYYFYACIECTYIYSSNTSHSLFYDEYFMSLLSLDHWHYNGSEKGCMILNTNIKLRSKNTVCPIVVCKTH